MGEFMIDTNLHGFKFSNWHDGDLQSIGHQISCWGFLGLGALWPALSFSCATAGTSLGWAHDAWFAQRQILRVPSVLWWTQRKFDPPKPFESQQRCLLVWAGQVFLKIEPASFSQSIPNSIAVRGPASRARTSIALIVLFESMPNLLLSRILRYLSTKLNFSSN